MKHITLDQDFNNAAIRLLLFKVECTSLHEMVVLKYLRQTYDGYNCN